MLRRSEVGVELKGKARQGKIRKRKRKGNPDDQDGIQGLSCRHSNPGFRKCPRRPGGNGLESSTEEEEDERHFQAKWHIRRALRGRFSHGIEEKLQVQREL